MPAPRVRSLRFFTVAALGTALASGLGWLALPDSAPRGAPAQLAAGKLSDRLSFAEEDVPVRQTRIYDTLAMFGMNTPEGQPWSERRAPTLAVLDPDPIPARAKVPTMPRMVAAERAPVRQPNLPPIRPVALASAATMPMPQVAAAEAVEPSREPIRLLGWDVPGSRHLPTRKDAARTAELIGDKAAKVGTGTASLVTGAASAVGDTVSSIGSTVAETVGWR
ncbi:hypothetical protein [uncultured Enterovirga sp.]|uniref:hypothetical protein n=1 Tax=uncultured Enterovirga sp. TaxID=2026352 RepID=UPI0035CC3DF0